MGHSQGAAAAWSLAQRQASRPVAGYRGAVALGSAHGRHRACQEGPSRPRSKQDTPLDEHVPQLPDPAHQGRHRRVPVPQPVAGMTELGRDRWVNVQEAVQGCLPTKQVASIGALLAELGHRNWTEHPTVLEFERRTGFGRKPLRGPLLIMSGDLDAITDIDSLKETVTDTCDALDSGASQESLHFVEYIGLNHFPVIQASQGKWLTGDANIGCSAEVVRGFGGEEAVHTLFPNSLLETAGDGNNWKYSL
ncbi:hypothetical protein FJTKL_07446 [Diaporthe vaccinii]|uniref:Uncharacterized protein n=1 Tax=Diaporthe vaccinii TaxID=105482 RepID=A0ABR4DPB8_9PEZI